MVPTTKFEIIKYGTFCGGSLQIYYSNSRCFCLEVSVDNYSQLRINENYIRSFIIYCFVRFKIYKKEINHRRQKYSVRIYFTFFELRIFYDTE